MEVRALLIRMRHAQQRLFVEQAPDERQRHRRAVLAEACGKITAGCPVRFVASNWPEFVGATITSTRCISASQACIACVRARFALMYSGAGMKCAERNVAGQAFGPAT